MTRDSNFLEKDVYKKEIPVTQKADEDSQKLH